MTNFYNQSHINTISGKPPVELYKFQEDYLRNLPQRYIFAADTGTGKTIMALAHYDKHAYLKPLLILAPAAKVNTGDWDREIKEYFAGRLNLPYEIWSYEKFRRGEWRNWLGRSDFALIADECHKIKNSQSQIGKCVFAISPGASFLVGLSATPLPNSWQDAANYFKIFGFVKHITEFRKKYCNIVTYKGFPELIGYRNINELRNYWNRIAKPLDKQLALDLPPLTVVPITLPSTPEYAKVLKEHIYQDKFLDNPSALLHGLRQSLIEPKLSWISDFLEGVSDNVIVFYNYIEEREQLLKICKKYNRRIFRQDGEKHEVPSKDRWAELNRTITLAQYQSGSTGIELTYAATTVYFSPTYSYSNYEQSIGRTNRAGQTQKMTLYLLCAPTTIEKDIWAALRNKSDFQSRQWLKEKLDSNGMITK